MFTHWKIYETKEDIIDKDVVITPTLGLLFEEKPSTTSRQRTKPPKGVTDHAV
jgi:hypothetical protein